MKQITAFALICLCGIASASTVSWSLLGKSFKTSDGANERASNYYVTVFLQDDYSDVMQAISAMDATPTAEQVNAVTAYVRSYDTTAKSGAAGGNFTLPDETYPSITTVNLFAIAWDATSIGEASNYLVSGIEKSDAYSGTDNPTNKGQFSSASYENKSWTPIPEPSVALMGLLGLGMLLKRRRA